MKFYFKSVNNHLPHYLNNFTPQFSARHQHYNFRNSTRLLPKIKHEFPRQSLRYRLIVTLNETSDDILEMVTTQSQKCFTKFIRERIVGFFLCFFLFFFMAKTVILLFVIFVMVDSLFHWYI